jgi:hypothetical protein
MRIKTPYLQFLCCDRYTGAAKLDDLLEICPKVLENLVSVPAIPNALFVVRCRLPKHQLLVIISGQLARAQFESDTLLPTASLVSLHNRGAYFVLLLKEMTFELLS